MKLAKNGGVFQAVAGAQSEMSDGWYKYISTAAEANTVGTISILATGAGVIQQNLEYLIVGRSIYAKPFTYTVTDPGLLPVTGATVSISTDDAGARVIFSGITDAFGVLRHSITGQLPWLDPGPYYFWTFADGHVSDNPDLETVT